MRLIRYQYIWAITAALVSCATAWPFFSNPVASAPKQKPLRVEQHNTGRSLYPYTLREHDPNAEICVAGSKQFTGMVSVSDEKKLFFWFFESRNDPSSSPVTIWLNGGPGGPSLFGLFLEIGPCVLNSHNNGTVFEKNSWTEFSNVLFIDQPAGVGFSTVNGSNSGGPDNVVEAAEDFTRFLITFFGQVFPQYAANPLHFAGESFAGKYIPGYVHYMEQRRKQGLLPSLPTIQSIILVDAVIDTVSSSVLSLYDHFCDVDDEIGAPTTKKPFNTTACDALENAAPECQRLDALCRDTYDGNVCQISHEVCFDTLGGWLMDDVREGGRDPYDDRKACGPNPPICEGFEGEGYAAYVNRSEVKIALGFEEDYVFSGINWDLNQRWERSKDIFVPTTRELAYILDETPIRVLVLNGNNDIIVNTEGQKRVYDHLSWRRQASFRMHRFRNWTWPNEDGKMTVGGQFKTANDTETVDKLAFMTINEAGHTSPGDQRQAVTWLMGCWTGAPPQGADERCFV
ncbi:carboxypeptidase Y [Apodospora peruviana]|uniref:Carboxypeptidase Y n=1 Tax=Apodospora peruviana TaxID=516989 RepID=A0AAE0I6C9_9PEZI|nr:carboxypeptidase Y [Apodospora peruviana]